MDTVRLPADEVAVDVDSPRPLAFYEKLGFEPVRHTMVAEVEA